MPVLPHKLYSYSIALASLAVSLTFAYQFFFTSPPPLSSTTTLLSSTTTLLSSTTTTVTTPYISSTPRSRTPAAMTSAAAIVVPAATKHTATFIFLHGLGDSGAGWASVSENFRLRRKFDECAFIFPHAPSIPITLNRGMRMPGWFDIFTLSDISGREDESGMLKSVEKVHGIIQEQIDKGIESERIIIGGFSQGGALALLSGLMCEQKLGGIVALSSWLPLNKGIASLRTNANKDTPIFQAHGEIDTVVRHLWGEQTKQALEGMGQEVEWHSYPGLEHSADPQEITDMEKWMQKRIPTNA